MRKLAPNEKTLFLVLCGAVFLALNLLSLRVFLNIHRELGSKIAGARSKIAEAKNIITLGEALQPAKDWLTAHPLPLWNNDQASAQLLKCERSEAEKNGLKILEENLLPPRASAIADSVSVQMKLSGPFEGLVKLLFELQSPTGWRAINKFIIKSDTEPTKVVIDLELKQFFRAIPVDTPPPSS
ncbi:MAG: type II secretion system protein M [Chthoniobacterales bacterium]|nr:type II secretion system protein M [Chthoniobacterales bacterium]